MTDSYSWDRRNDKGQRSVPRETRSRAKRFMTTARHVPRVRKTSCLQGRRVASGPARVCGPLSWLFLVTRDLNSLGLRSESQLRYLTVPPCPKTNPPS